MREQNNEALQEIDRAIKKLFIQLEVIKEALVYMEQHYEKRFDEISNRENIIKNMVEDLLYKENYTDDRGCLKRFSSEVRSLNSAQKQIRDEMKTMNELVRLLVVNNLLEGVQEEHAVNVYEVDNGFAGRLSECILGLYEKYKKSSKCEIAGFMCNNSLKYNMINYVHDNIDFYEETEIIVAIFRDYEFNYAVFTDKALYIKSSCLNTYKRLYRIKFSDIKEVVSVGSFEVIITGRDNVKQRRIDFVGLDSRMIRSLLNDVITKKCY